MQPCDSLLLFVYGTLKRGERNHPLLKDEKYLGDTGTSPNYLLVDLGPYPGMVEKPLGGFSVQGELFEIPYALLIELDKIEGSPFLFNLELITLVDGSKAFSYLYKQSIQGGRILSEGVWPA
jgi:gamma-glutamylaminecyclotransferase